MTGTEKDPAAGADAAVFGRVYARRVPLLVRLDAERKQRRALAPTRRERRRQAAARLVRRGGALARSWVVTLFEITAGAALVRGAWLAWEPLGWVTLAVVLGGAAMLLDSDS